MSRPDPYPLQGFGFHVTAEMQLFLFYGAALGVLVFKV